MNASRSPQTPRADLIAVALELLEDHHPEDLSLREVARRAGRTSGAPAHHFGSKLGLLAACAEMAWAELCDQMESTGSGAGPEERLRAKARTYIDYALGNPGLYRLMASRRFDDAERFPEIFEWRDRVMRSVVDLIPAPADDPEHPRLRGLAIWALLHGFLTLLLDGAFAEPKIAPLTDDISRMAVVIGLLPP